MALIGTGAPGKNPPGGLRQYNPENVSGMYLPIAAYYGIGGGGLDVSDYPNITGVIVVSDGYSRTIRFPSLSGHNRPGMYSIYLCDGYAGTLHDVLPVNLATDLQDLRCSGNPGFLGVTGLGNTKCSTVMLDGCGVTNTDTILKDMLTAAAVHSLSWGCVDLSQGMFPYCFNAAPTGDMVVSGNPSPDITGTFTYDGNYEDNGCGYLRPYWKKTVGGTDYYLWFHWGDCWRIDDDVPGGGNQTLTWYDNNGLAAPWSDSYYSNNYTPTGGASGTPVVVPAAGSGWKAIYDLVRAPYYYGVNFPWVTQTPPW